MKISIIVLTKNSSETMRTCLDSLCSQDMSDVEVIFKDSVSLDGTTKIIKEYCGSFTVKFLSWPDMNIYDGLNQAVSLASGDYIGILHSDDRYYDRDVLKDVKDSLAHECDLLYGNLIMEDNKGRFVRYWNAGNFKFYKRILGFMPPHPTTFYQKELLLKYPYDVRFKISGDYDHFLTISKNKTCVMKYLPQTITIQRTGGTSNGSIKKFFKRIIEDSTATRNASLPLITVIMKRLLKLKQFR